MNDMNEPKLRDGRKLHCNEPYALGAFSDDLIRKIGSEIIYMLYTGRTDLTGNDWSDIFARSIGGESFNSPTGVADVAKGKMAWSMKTVKAPKPIKATSVRLISGRCSPDYSFGIENPHDDIQKTGDAVLAIWNARVDIAYKNFNPVRVNVLIRDPKLSEFCIFEEVAAKYDLKGYKWKENKDNNLEGYDLEGRHSFTWQPHGSQFTIITDVPENNVKFTVKVPEKLSVATALRSLHFDDSWITIIR